MNENMKRNAHIDEKLKMSFSNAGMSVDVQSEASENPARHPDGTLLCDGDVDDDFVPTHFAIHLGARLS